MDNEAKSAIDNAEPKEEKEKETEKEKEKEKETEKDNEKEKETAKKEKGKAEKPKKDKEIKAGSAKKEDQHEEPPTKKPKKGETNEVDALWKQGDALKRTWASACAASMELVAKIGDDPEWGWARSSGQLPELKRAQAQVQGACGPWARCFLMSESSPPSRRRSTQQPGRR